MCGVKVAVRGKQKIWLPLGNFDRGVELRSRFESPGSFTSFRDSSLASKLCSVLNATTTTRFTHPWPEQRSVARRSKLEAQCGKFACFWALTGGGAKGPSLPGPSN
jgi:hypothetical protein